MEGHCSTGQSPQWAVVPVEEDEEKEEKEEEEDERKKAGLSLVRPSVTDLSSTIQVTALVRTEWNT